MAKEPQIRIATEKEIGKLFAKPAFCKLFNRTIKEVAKASKNKTRVSKRKRKT